MGSNKPRGLQAARKLRISRRENRWVSFCIHLLSLNEYDLKVHLLRPTKPTKSEPLETFIKHRLLVVHLMPRG